MRRPPKVTVSKKLKVARRPTATPLPADESETLTLAPPSPGPAALVGTPAEDLAHLLDDILTGPEEEPREAPDASPPAARTVEEAFARLQPLAAPVLADGADASSFAEDFSPSEFAIPGPDGDLADGDLADGEDVLVLGVDVGEVVEPAAPPEPEAEPDSAPDPGMPAADEDVLVLGVDVGEVVEPPVPAELPAPAGDEDVLVLGEDVGEVIETAAPDESFLATLPPYEPPPEGDDPLVEQPQPAEPGAPPQPDVPPLDRDRVLSMVATLLAMRPNAGGRAQADLTALALPERLDALAALLAETPPSDDFAALDLLYACWPRTTTNSPDPALLAAALNLSQNFGLPDRTPMAGSKAWRMLDPVLFEQDLADCLSAIADFISSWQREQSMFLILEFSEVELIEYLFETLPPGRHGKLLAQVMNFKVLSNRRMGLLRRIPGRLRKQVQPMLPAGKAQALTQLAHAKALLDGIAAPPGFPPILEAAAKAAEEVEKLMKAVAAIGAPPPPGPPGGGALGRIG